MRPSQCKYNDAGEHYEAYKYIVKQKAKSRAVNLDKDKIDPESNKRVPVDKGVNLLDAAGREIRFDEGHDGLRLKDFQDKARKRWNAARSQDPSIPEFDMTLTEIAVLRMYTWNFYDVWNNALRRLKRSDDGLGWVPDEHCTGIEEWATCIAVLFSAVMKLTSLPPKVVDRWGQEQDVTRLYRGVKEEPPNACLPESFYKKTSDNLHPGGPASWRLDPLSIFCDAY